MTSGKCLHSFEDDHNQVYALDYNDEGTKFVTAGKDTAIRVYDEATKTNISTMQGGVGYSVKTTPGHSNRIFSVKYTTDENMIVSGGWDNTVQIWDIRVVTLSEASTVPMCVAMLDIHRNEIVTGSWRPQHQLEVWDYGSGQKISEIPWNSSQFSGVGSSCMLYAAQFSKEGQGRFIAAGGSGANEAKVFDHQNGNAVVGTVTGLTRGIFSVDFSPDNEKVAIGGGDACIRILDVAKHDRELEE
eukprot:CAMPEP_0116897852 /NCGR_PEP_ID=MMETSP0467-20121206/6716_1 /TAXON_ID=283647 /ORGANISM="Mesodinium pulex, Strain SPMC105" /LENGTH=243 /DNA_ID=CAMNT_0004569677 /DNA_START=262 /DNA_END=994 /DNA_ORIENTATION=+